jgi:excisionase family DNA binding protein
MSNYNNPFEPIYEKLDGLQQQFAAFAPTAAPQIEVISRDELCRRLAITEPTCIRWEKKGKIPSIRIGSNVRYNWYAVIEALEKKGGSKL